MAFNNQRISYFNTLIFTIISGIASLLLLCSLFFETFKKYFVCIVTIEIGIFIIIAYCIYKIVKNDNFLKDLLAHNKIVINFDECGDYFIRRTDNKGLYYCSNDYVITDDTNTSYIMKIYPSSMDLPLTNSLNYSGSNTSFASGNRLESYQLRELADNSNFATNTDRCRPLYQNVTGYSGYNQVPWTYARSRCESYHE